MANEQINSIIIARQPIFDVDLKVYAYELLFRGHDNHHNSGVTADSGDHATSQVINHAFMELGIDRVIGNKIAFINLTKNFILTDDPLPFTQDRVVLEILEDVVVTDEIIEAVKKLVAQGYIIALDDFIFDESLRPLVKLSKIIKIDLLALSDDELREHVAILKQEGVQLLAEKVETQEQYQLCQELGFDFYQGYFFCKPSIMTEEAIPDDNSGLFRILNALQNPDVEIDDVELLISQDVGLSYKLLRLLNSASIGLPRKVESIRQGLVILGLKAIKSWATLIALNNLPTKIPEIMTNALVRAKMCEELAGAYNCDKGSAFMIGLFSSIDAIMSRPMDELLDELPLSEEIKQTLLQQDGALGQLLKDVIHYEQGSWDSITPSSASFDDLASSYLMSTEWTINTQASL